MPPNLEFTLVRKYYPHFRVTISLSRMPSFSGDCHLFSVSNKEKNKLKLQTVKFYKRVIIKHTIHHIYLIIILKCIHLTICFIHSWNVTMTPPRVKQKQKLYSQSKTVRQTPVGRNNPPWECARAENRNFTLSSSSCAHRSHICIVFFSPSHNRVCVCVSYVSGFTWCLRVCVRPHCFSFRFGKSFG